MAQANLPQGVAVQFNSDHDQTLADQLVPAHTLFGSPTNVSFTSNVPPRRSRSSLTMAVRSFCSSSQAVRKLPSPSCAAGQQRRCMCRMIA